MVVRSGEYPVQSWESSDLVLFNMQVKNGVDNLWSPIMNISSSLSFFLFHLTYSVLIFHKHVDVILNSQVTILLTHLIFFCTNSSCSSSGCSVFQVMMTMMIKVRMIMKMMIAISKQKYFSPSVPNLFFKSILCFHF